MLSSTISDVGDYTLTTIVRVPRTSYGGSDILHTLTTYYTLTSCVTTLVEGATFTSSVFYSIMDASMQVELPVEQLDDANAGSYPCGYVLSGSQITILPFVTFTSGTPFFLNIYSHDKLDVVTETQYQFRVEADDYTNYQATTATYGIFTILITIIDSCLVAETTLI